jgi:hypothetical protein
MSIKKSYLEEFANCDIDTRRFHFCGANASAFFCGSALVATLFQDAAHQSIIFNCAVRAVSKQRVT